MENLLGLVAILRDDNERPEQAISFRDVEVLEGLRPNRHAYQFRRL